MNADMLKRVVRAIADGTQNDLDRLAAKIVESEQRTGHEKLANQLEAILKQSRPRAASQGIQRTRPSRRDHKHRRVSRYGTFSSL